MTRKDFTEVVGLKLGHKKDKGKEWHEQNHRSNEYGKTAGFERVSRIPVRKEWKIKLTR